MQPESLSSREMLHKIDRRMNALATGLARRT